MTKRCHPASRLRHNNGFERFIDLVILVALCALLTLAGVAQAQPALPSGVAKERDFGTIIRLSKWPTNTLSVCWENPSPTDETLRSVVRRAAEETWGANSALVFIGWGVCEENSAGIRILIDEAHPHVKKIGRFGDGLRDGMVLNFSFEKWAPTCRLRIEFCVYAIAAHEFGHAIGFTHEQNRSDAPEECKADSQGVTGDFLVTRYDNTSIMNYCSPAWNGNGKLSELDTVSVRAIYGERYP